MGKLNLLRGARAEDAEAEAAARAAETSGG